MRTIKPIFLLADSQLLFWKNEGELFTRRFRSIIESDESRPEGEITAAYIGASNGDKPEYYDIFCAAMNQMGVSRCRHISAQPDADDYTFLRTADLVLLAGGSISRGWEAFKATEMIERITQCYHNGALLVGISAGAIQLGLRGWHDHRKLPEDLFETFQLVPAVIDVHDEQDWEELQKLITHLGKPNRGYGIPAGAGAVYHPDWSFEALRRYLVEISYLEEEVKRSLVFPRGRGEEDVDEPDDNDFRGTVIKPDEVLTSGIITIDPEIIET